jgi:hypothetical protein
LLKLVQKIKLTANKNCIIVILMSWKFDSYDIWVYGSAALFTFFLKSNIHINYGESENSQRCLRLAEIPQVQEQLEILRGFVVLNQEKVANDVSTLLSKKTNPNAVFEYFTDFGKPDQNGQSSVFLRFANRVMEARIRTVTEFGFVETIYRNPYHQIAGHPPGNGYQFQTIVSPRDPSMHSGNCLWHSDRLGLGRQKNLNLK